MLMWSLGSIVPEGPVILPRGIRPQKPYLVWLVGPSSTIAVQLDPLRNSNLQATRNKKFRQRPHKAAKKV